MKLMKHITIALVLCAIPAVAFGQTAACDGCDHQVSVYHGSGGLIATADDAEMVNYRASCGGVTRTGELEANDDGVVSMLLTGDLACMDEDGTFELGPIMDGGWFWITDETNSAVGGLVSKDILDNEDTDLTDAGEGVTMTMGAGAVLLKETATGRVGLLPNILPEPPAPDAVTCGARATPNTNPTAYTSQASRSCMLGGGGTKIQVVGPAAHGRRGQIAGGTVTRPATGNPLMLDVDLWVDESGSYNTGNLDDSAGGDSDLANRGWIGKGTANWIASVGWFAGLSGATPGANLAGAAVAITDDDNDGQAEIAISPSPTYCPATGTQTTASVTILAFGSGATLPDAFGGGTATTGVSDSDTIFPSFATHRALGGARAGTTLTIACPPPAAANQGQELVPENPFPTDK